MSDGWMLCWVGLYLSCGAWIYLMGCVRLARGNRRPIPDPGRFLAVLVFSAFNWPWLVGLVLIEEAVGAFFRRPGSR